MCNGINDILLQKGGDQMAQQACLTLYNAIKDSTKIIDAMKHHFEAIATTYTAPADGIQIQLFDESVVEVHIMNDMKEVNPQIAGMQNYFAQAPCNNKELMEKVMLQISLFNCITGITFVVDEQEDRTNAIIGRIYAVANDCACIILYPDMSMYTADGKLLLSIQGNSDLNAYNPIAYQDFVMEEPDFKEEDIQRYENIKAELEAHGYPCISHIMSTQLTKVSLYVPEIKEIAKRAVAIFACAVCAEGTLMENGSRKIGLREFKAMDKQFHCKDFLSKKERAFIEARKVDESTSIQFSWRYECCAVMLWALGFMELNDFDSICDVAGMATIIRSFDSIEDMCKAANRRSDDELLDMHTRVLYYDWACVDARIHQKEMEGIDPGVVQEHHYAFNWLCGANHTDDWDQIQPNT